MLTEEPKISNLQQIEYLNRKRKNDVVSENEMRRGKTKLGRRGQDVGFVTGPTYGRRRVARQNGSGRQRRQSVRSLLLHLLLHLLLNLLLVLHLLLLLTVERQRDVV
jgi:hypothetical protein